MNLHLDREIFTEMIDILNAIADSMTFIVESETT